MFSQRVVDSFVHNLILISGNYCRYYKATVNGGSSQTIILTLQDFRQHYFSGGLVLV